MMHMLRYPTGTPVPAPVLHPSQPRESAIVQPPQIPSPPIQPSCYHSRAAVHAVWRVLCASVPGIIHHPANAFTCSDRDGWSYEIIPAPGVIDPDAFVIVVRDELSLLSGYL